MREPPKALPMPSTNSEKIKQMAQVLDALSYLNIMLDDDENSDVSVLLDSTFNILNIAYQNVAAIQYIKMAGHDLLDGEAKKKTKISNDIN